jgi:hypothetical protein
MQCCLNIWKIIGDAKNYRKISRAIGNNSILEDIK